MSNLVRPTLLGYIRADVLNSHTEIRTTEAELHAFAEAEEFSLGTIYIERGIASGAFHALMSEMRCQEAARGLVVPDLRHVTVLEQLVLARHEDGARTPIFAARVPSGLGGPGAKSPSRARPAVPALPDEDESGGPRVRT